ncbi:hypothetical protein VTK73DRAFT_5782 [Phialemonium thermophilum]|uniref:Uncharacterized protein n=1 Tax=Phialemonium thermophilum TaxID=223376 RepID=A0ABR3V0R7_9PEZI
MPVEPPSLTNTPRHIVDVHRVGKKSKGNPIYCYRSPRERGVGRSCTTIQATLHVVVHSSLTTTLTALCFLADNGDAAFHLFPPSYRSPPPCSATESSSSSSSSSSLISILGGPRDDSPLLPAQPHLLLPRCWWWCW